MKKLYFQNDDLCVCMLGSIAGVNLLRCVVTVSVNRAGGLISTSPPSLLLFPAYHFGPSIR